MTYKTYLFEWIFEKTEFTIGSAGARSRKLGYGYFDIRILSIRIWNWNLMLLQLQLWPSLCPKRCILVTMRNGNILIYSIDILIIIVFDILIINIWYSCLANQFFQVLERAIVHVYSLRTLKGIFSYCIIINANLLSGSRRIGFAFLNWHGIRIWQR